MIWWGLQAGKSPAVVRHFHAVVVPDMNVSPSRIVPAAGREWTAAATIPRRGPDGLPARISNSTDQTWLPEETSGTTCRHSDRNDPSPG